jgi:predicted GIY-YIG superfamily endonuclease
LSAQLFATNTRPDVPNIEFFKDRWGGYILECQDGAIYTGMTRNHARRFADHANCSIKTPSCRFVLAHGGVQRILHVAYFHSKDEALKWEKTTSVELFIKYGTERPVYVVGNAFPASEPVADQLKQAAQTQTKPMSAPQRRRTGLTRVTGRVNFYSRLYIPRHLRQLAGRCEAWRSLNTSEEALAQERAMQLKTAWRLFCRMLKNTPRPAAEVRHLINTFLDTWSEPAQAPIGASPSLSAA